VEGRCEEQKVAVPGRLAQKPWKKHLNAILKACSVPADADEVRRPVRP
jgi:hypothetical protein